MEVSAVEEQICPCYKESQPFQKLVELKEFGLAVYCHTACSTDKIRHSGADDAINTSRDVFILHNKKDVKITTSQLTPVLEKKNISCPRCRKRFKHAQELIKEVKSIDKKIVMSMCDHCRKRTEVRKIPFCACQKIVKLFKTVKDEQMEDTKKHVKVMPSKKGHFRKDKGKDIHSYSNIQINQDFTLQRDSAATGHEPEVRQMFYSDNQYLSDVTEMSETDSLEVCIKQAVEFTEPVRSTKTSLVQTPQEYKKIDSHVPDVSLIDSDTTFVETFVGAKELPRPSIKKPKQKEIFKDTPTLDAKEELKRRHDISLRQIVKLEKDSRGRERPNVYETPKITHNVDDFSTSLKFGHSNEKVVKSKQHVAKSKSLPNASVGNVLKPNFSFIFPKEKKKEKQINIEVTSSQLIKATQERFRLESERLKRREEEERQRKQEREQKKILAREERKRQAEEKKRLADEAKRLADEAKRLADEEKKKVAEEQQSLAKRDKSKEIILGKDKKSDVVKKDMKSKPVQSDKDSVLYNSVARA